MAIQIDSTTEVLELVRLLNRRGYTYAIGGGLAEGIEGKEWFTPGLLLFVEGRYAEETAEAIGNNGNYWKLSMPRVGELGELQVRRHLEYNELVVLGVSQDNPFWKQILQYRVEEQILNVATHNTILTLDLQFQELSGPIDMSPQAIESRLETISDLYTFRHRFIDRAELIGPNDFSKKETQTPQED